jgi:transcription-repair coupling factor (superfamily II helicase)
MLDTILKQTLGVVNPLIDKINPNAAAKAQLNHCAGSLDAIVISQLFERTRKTIFCVFPDFEKAQFFKGDLESLGLATSTLFPPTFVKPYSSNHIQDLHFAVSRAEAVEAIAEKPNQIWVCSADAIAELVNTGGSVLDKRIQLEANQSISMDTLAESLVDIGYEPVNFVNAPGEFARRGGIVDVFPYSANYPVRLEFFGDEVDSIREFDVDNQRSIAFLNDTRFIPNVTKNDSDGIYQSFTDLAPAGSFLYIVDPNFVDATIEAKYEEAISAYDEILADKDDQRDLPVPEIRYLMPEKWTALQEQFSVLLNGSSKEKNLAQLAFKAKPQPDLNGTIKLLKADIKERSLAQTVTYILCDNEGQRDRFEELLGEYSDENRYFLSVNTLHRGFILENADVAVYTDHQIFNRYHRPSIKKQKKFGGISFKELKDLNIGDYVVHVDYGVARFQGFTQIEVRGVQQEAVVLKYAEDAVLYVNVSSLHKIQKYSGKDGTAPKVTKLGTGEWAKKKAKTKSRVRDIARDLIKLYAKRKATQAFPFANDTPWQIEMEARFEFEETPDQMEAIEKVKEDMQSTSPMDRLVCGDVGFGKTEVAVRAAFKAVMDQKQVAILVPTTILADQHYKTFCKRMKDFPIRVEAISRFRTAAEQTQIKKDAKAGLVDILIGTHRITSKDIEFKDLGLLVIDEEQRFGVAAKERLKSMRTAVDVLTLTATPIPRTLQFSLMGARDLSIINTAPPNRQPVYTEIHTFDHRLIRDAIMQETSRGGQVFFVHNRVANISEMADMITKLVPDVRVRFAHGQMTSNQLEKIVKDFYEHKFDVLVSTNIIESGIDIANANTIIINQANRFGLSELHQLRGRVGRSSRKAFCYLITPPLNSLSLDARRRLTALEEFSDLGSGFNIAMRDLDIRGAGDILGGEQSGFITDIGFELYHKLLDETIAELKQGEFKELFGETNVKQPLPETQVEFDENAQLDGLYVEDNVERLNLYRKLSQARNLIDIQDWEQEVVDRFGPLPKSGEKLLYIAKVKLLASECRFVKVIIRAGRMWLQAPDSKTNAGLNFYEDGVFQKIMDRVNLIAADRYQLSQKDDNVRLIILNIANLSDAYDFLLELSEYDDALATV